MPRTLIIDDDKVRVPVLTKYAEEIVGTGTVVHSTTFTAENWDSYDLILLDHDLGEGGDVSHHVRKAFPEGYHGTAWIVVHSMNPVGAKNIIHALDSGRVMPYSSILSRYTLDSQK